MAKNKLRQWANEDLSSFCGKQSIIKVPSERGTASIDLYTHENKYTITAKGNYMGCIVVSRKMRINEDWFRGNDLADGTYTKKTWYKIVANIAAYELIRR